MPARQIILDTETTGLRVEDGHRIIEVGCLEMVNRRLTGNHFHRYLNPGREVEAGAVAVHGITNEFLADKEKFSDVAKELVEFISGSELIIHNAPFDLSFLNYELSLTARGFKLVTDYCQVLDTLLLARQLHVGQRNSLDALCKRYGVDNTKREYHGALLDAHLLTEVYLAMTGGQGSFFEEQKTRGHQAGDVSSEHQTLKSHKINVIMATDVESDEHKRYLDKMSGKGNCLWAVDKTT